MTLNRQLAEAQTLPKIQIGGQTYDRVAFGADRPPDGVRCRDCKTVVGQLHVPGCSLESCPQCGDAALTCACVASEARMSVRGIVASLLRRLGVSGGPRSV